MRLWEQYEGSHAALLVELGIDEKKNIEANSFDQTIGDLKAAGVTVAKSGTLKALNKHRVLAKHYGQLAEPTTVHGYAEAAEFALDKALRQVVGKGLYEIYVTELLQPGESRDVLESAGRYIDDENYLDALLDVRKALFIEIEADYSIHGWKDLEGADGGGVLNMFARGGMKASYWKRDKKWIDEHVKDPFDYVQIDYSQLRLDAMEWGVNTAELESLLRLTPQVFRERPGADWHTKYEMSYVNNQANLANAKYCLDRTISVVLKKHAHGSRRRWPARQDTRETLAGYVGSPVFERAATDSAVIHSVSDSFDYFVDEVVSGFDPSRMFFRIIGAPKEGTKESMFAKVVAGYLLVREDADSQSQPRDP